MSGAAEFYRDRHARDADYAGGTYDLASLFRHRAFRRWAGQLSEEGPALLDVGLGKGKLIRGVATELDRLAKPARRIVGLDLVESPGHVFDALPAFEFHQQDLDGRDLPLDTDSMDLVICNHVLEHVFETEHLVRELCRITAPSGLCVIGVPNIAAWVNRVAFALWGNPPLGSELGTESITYGFRPRFLQSKLAGFRPSSHIRDFVPRGLSDLSEACGFRTLGWWKQDFGLLARVHPWASRNMAILLEPSPKP